MKSQMSVVAQSIIEHNDRGNGGVINAAQVFPGCRTTDKHCILLLVSSSCNNHEGGRGLSGLKKTDEGRIRRSPL